MTCQIKERLNTKELEDELLAGCSSLDLLIDLLNVSITAKLYPLQKRTVQVKEQGLLVNALHLNITR